jgi:glutamate---cysteine ligase / carboxylate-amine ligase
MAVPTHRPEAQRVDAWFEWATDDHGYTVGAEEEFMLVHPPGWALAQTVETVLPSLPPKLARDVQGETHGSALEIGSAPHRTVAEVEDELRSLRRQLTEVLEPMGLRAASAGTHPFAVWHDTVVSSGERYQAVYGSMRELARREPTFALHVHVGVPDPEDAIGLLNRMRAHIPLLLALSANSPFWQGRDSGLASARTPLFQAFPRVGIPRVFNDYSDYVEAVDLLVRCGSIPEPTFLWWDVRPQPRFGTIEVRIMDAQTRVEQTAAITALVQSIARLEIESGYVTAKTIWAAEVLDENRFLAARDGMDANLIDVDTETRVPAREMLEDLLRACEPHAEALGCADELARVRDLAGKTGADRQLELADGEDRLPGLVETLADAFVS